MSSADFSLPGGWYIFVVQSIMIHLILCKGITEECKSTLVKFASEAIDRGWLICLLSSPPVIVAATARGKDAASDVQLLRACLPIGLVVSGCWQLHDGDDALSGCSRMWHASGASDLGYHLGLTAAGGLATDISVVPIPESRLLNICYSLSVTSGHPLLSMRATSGTIISYHLVRILAFAF
jgi:hypothetical protein